MLLKRTVTCDPGETTAVAYWDGTLLPQVKAFSCKRKTCASELQQLEALAIEFEAYIAAVRPSAVYIEGAEIYTTSNSNNIRKLAYIIGRYQEICRRAGACVHMLRPRDWKGTLPDAVVRRRVTALTGTKYKSYHEADVVGMGLHLMGRFEVK